MSTIKAFQLKLAKYQQALDPRITISHTNPVPFGTKTWLWIPLNELFKGIVMTLIKNIGFIFLAVYLILVALTALTPGIAIPSVVIGIVALVAAIFILIGK